MVKIYDISIRLLSSPYALVRILGKVLYLIPKAYTKRMMRYRKKDAELEKQIEALREDIWTELKQKLDEKNK